MADYVLSAKGTYDGSDFDSGIDKSNSKLREFMEQASSIGKQVKSALGSAVVKTADMVTSSIGTIGAAVTGIAVQGGIARALSIEQARYKLKQMGLDVTSIMASAQKSVDGTKFGLDAAATSATILGTSGVEAGEQMTRALETAAGVATISGDSMEDIADIMAKVAAKGKVGGDELLSFSMRGINATDALAKHLNMTQAEVKDLVSKGKIDFQTFSDAMYETFGEAAAGANDTFSGAMANMRAALSRTGLLFTSPALSALTPIFSKLREVINSCNTALAPLGDAFARFLGMTPELDELGNKTGAFLVEAGGRVDQFIGLLDSLKAKIDGLGEGGFLNISNGAKIAAAAIALLTVGSMGGLVAEIPVVGTALGGLFGMLGKLATPVGTLTSSFGGLSDVLGTISAPVALAVAAVVALVAAFAVSMATNEEFRNTIMGLVGDIANSLAPAFQSLQGLLPGIQGLFQSFMNVVQQLAPAVLGLVAAIAPVVSTIVSSAVPVINTLMGIIASLLEQITGLVVPIINMIAETISAIMPQIQEIITTTMTAIQAIIDTAWPYIQEVVTSAMAAIQAIVETVWPIIESAISAALAVIQAVINTVMAAINGDWEGVWNGILSILSAIWEGIKSVVTTAISAVQDNIGNVLAALKALWDSIWNAIKALVTTVWNSIKAVISGAASAISGVVSSMANAVSNFFRNMLSSVTSTVSSMWSNAKSAFSNGVSNVVSKVGELPGKIKGFFSNAGSWLISSGRAIIDGLIQGIRAGFSAAAGVVSDGLAGLRSLFPFSPAKRGPFSGRGWVLYSGMSIMSALAEGADRKAASTVAAFAGIADKVKDSLDFGGQTLAYELSMSALPAYSYGNLGYDSGAGESFVTGDVITIGDVTLDASSLEDIATLEEFVEVLKRAKRSNPSKARG